LGDWEIPAGSIIDPLHVSCRASSANAAMVVKPQTIVANLLVRSIDTTPVAPDTMCPIGIGFNRT
jgi:hypothetical protein